MISFIHGKCARILYALFSFSSGIWLYVNIAIQQKYWALGFVVLLILSFLAFVFLCNSKILKLKIFLVCEGLINNTDFLGIVISAYFLYNVVIKFILEK